MVPQKRKGWLVGGAIAAAIIIVLFIINLEEITTWYERFGVVLRQAAVTGLLIGSVYGLVALGLTLIFGVLNIINFAHGALMTVGLYVTFILFDRHGVDPYLSLLVTIPVLFVLGLIIQRVVIHPARNAPHHNQLLLTLGLSLVIENALLVAFTATPRSIRLDYGRGLTAIGPLEIDFPIRIMGTTITFTRLMAFVCALLVTFILYYLLQKTDLGKAIRATAQSKEGAALVGINIDWINMVTFGIGTACVGAAASLVLPFMAVDPVAGNLFNITAFVIVVLGGMGNVFGALIGGLIVGLTQELWLVFFPQSSKLLGVFIIFILVLLFRPQGIFGGKRS